MRGRSSLTESEFSEEEPEGAAPGRGRSEGSLGGASPRGPQEDARPGKRRSRPARSKARRVAANVRERKRILDYNQAFNALRCALRHDLSGKRLSKIATLRRAINRISALSVFLRAHPGPAPPPARPCAHLECHGRADGPGEGLPEGYLPPAHSPPPLYPAPPSPHYPHFSTDAQLCVPHERFPGPRDALHSPPLYAGGSGGPGAGGYSFGVRATCHQNHMDAFAERHPAAPLAWQLGYLQGAPGFQQSLSMH